MKKMVNVAGGVLVALVAATAMAGPVSPMVATLEARGQEARRTSTLRGTIKSVDDATAVIVPAENKKTEVPFKLTPGTAKTGACGAGDTVTVSYYFEQGQRVATALAGKTSK
ncbi:MAG: hypothetical protein IT184_12615 [Acidobacteria bacterium]|nr:hypothetical protein [Acidobacteriota bacterium]